MGEGGAILVIEALEQAQARGATILGGLVGYGASAAACHLTAGPEDGDGAARSRRIALARAGVAPEAIGHLNAHAPSTPVGNKGEQAHIRRRHFGRRTSLAALRRVVDHDVVDVGPVAGLLVDRAPHVVDMRLWRQSISSVRPRTKLLCSGMVILLVKMDPDRRARASLARA